MRTTQWVVKPWSEADVLIVFSPQSTSAVSSDSASIHPEGIVGVIIAVREYPLSVAQYI